VHIHAVDAYGYRRRNLSGEPDLISTNTGLHFCGSDPADRPFLSGKMAFSACNFNYHNPDTFVIGGWFSALSIGMSQPKKR